jgi:glycine hydroxymethyltransferase
MDKELWDLVKKEIKRQEECIDLIPSENLIDIETMFLVGSPLSNKYAEGYVGKRYYPGNEYIDKIEFLAKKRALKAFDLNPKIWDVNVQPYSGSPANLAVYLGLINPGETIMGLNLFHGGHLTHGHKASYTGKLFNSIQYGVTPQINADTTLMNADKDIRVNPRHNPRLSASKNDPRHRSAFRIRIYPRV